MEKYLKKSLAKSLVGLQLKFHEKSLKDFLEEPQQEFLKNKSQDEFMERKKITRGNPEEFLQ